MGDAEYPEDSEGRKLVSDRVMTVAKVEKDPATHGIYSYIHTLVRRVRGHGSRYDEEVIVIGLPEPVWAPGEKVTLRLTTKVGTKGNMNTSELAELVEAAFTTSDNNDGPDGATIADGLFAIARSIQQLAKSVERLGTNGASDQRGAVELLSMEMKDGLAGIASAIAEQNMG